MCKTKLHTKQNHEQNHGKTTVKKQTVQQLSENMHPKLNPPTPTQTKSDKQKLTAHQRKIKKLSKPQVKKHLKRK
jgi:hypothetical protein